VFVVVVSVLHVFQNPAGVVPDVLHIASAADREHPDTVLTMAVVIRVFGYLAGIHRRMVAHGCLGLADQYDTNGLYVPHPVSRRGRPIRSRSRRASWSLSCLMRSAPAAMPASQARSRLDGRTMAATDDAPTRSGWGCLAPCSREDGQAWAAAGPAPRRATSWWTRGYRRPSKRSAPRSRSQATGSSTRG
jgi:hypothetical protein